MLDLLITGGSYPDFDAGVMKQANIGVSEGKIAYIGPGEPAARQVADASGKVVSPGFIDIHMHEERFLTEGEQYVIAQKMLEMGVTTAVGGNCGTSRQPLSHFKAVLRKLGGAPVNYIILSGYNRFRRELGIGSYEHATKDQWKKMRSQIREELEEGAWGITFGIEYDPGLSTEEMLYALHATDDPHLIAAAHYRSDAGYAVPSIREMLLLSDNSAPKFQISHLSSCAALGQMKESLALINAAIERDPTLSYDTYPYAAFSTRIGSAVFDEHCFERWNKTYSDIMLTLPPYAGMRCTKEIFEDAQKNYPDMLAVAFVMNEEEIAAAITNPYGMVASDATINGGKGHPRAAGTFPRVLGKYVREEKRLTLIEALRKMTLLPAERLELSDKGRIAEGCDADLTVFYPETIRDGATFTDLDIQPEGIEQVYIGGRLALDRKVTVDPRLGRFLSYKDPH